MTLYITPDNQLHDDANGFALSLEAWPDNAVIATQEQIDAINLINNPPLTSKQIALNQIAELESTVTERRLREAILGIDGGWLSSINAQIAALRAVQ
jgi:hypothetical protein